MRAKNQVQDAGVRDASHGGRLVIRPSHAYAANHEGLTRAWPIALLLAFAATGLAFGLRSSLWWLVGGLAGGTAALLAHLGLYFRNVAVFADEGVFGRVTALGHVRAYSRDRLARVVMCRVSYGFAPTPGRPEIYFLDSTGKVITSLKGSGWRLDDLAALWQYLRMQPQGSFDKPISLHHLNANVPVAWIRRYSAIVAILVMFIFVLGLTLLLSHYGIHLRR